MEIHRLNISKEQIERIEPPKERVFFLQMLNLVTEINVFQKLLLYSMSYPRNKVQTEAKVQISINLLYVLSGKLYEGWKLIDETRHGKKKPKSGKPKKCFAQNWFPNKYEPLLTIDGQKSLKFLENYFDHSNNLKTIRDQFAFHFDEKASKKFLVNTDFEPIKLYLPPNVGEVFSTASFVSLKGFFAELKQEQGKSFDGLMEEILEVARNFTRIISDYVGIVHDNFLKDSKLESMAISDPKPINKMHLTFFTKNV